MSEDLTGHAMNRSKLRFVELVEDAFRFLVEDYGFLLTIRIPPTFVRYESAAMFLNVYHGRQSYEMNVEIGEIADPACRSYRLYDVLSAILDRDDKSSISFQASDPQGVRQCVQALASLVARHYHPVLMGYRTMLDRIEAHTSERAQATTREIVQRPVREAAEEAWRAKDYTKVEELYESIRDNLTQVERKRLQYANKHRLG